VAYRRHLPTNPERLLLSWAVRPAPGVADRTTHVIAQTNPLLPLAAALCPSELIRKWRNERCSSGWPLFLSLIKAVLGTRPVASLDGKFQRLTHCRKVEKHRTLSFDSVFGRDLRTRLDGGREKLLCRGFRCAESNHSLIPMPNGIAWAPARAIQLLRNPISITGNLVEGT